VRSVHAARRSTFGVVLGCAQHHLPETHDAEVGLAQQFARAVGDETLTIGDCGILFGDAADAGVTPLPLLCAVYLVVVVAVADRYVVRVHRRKDA
jgi:hypothetical protein